MEISRQMYENACEDREGLAKLSREIEAERKAAQEVADHRLGAITMLHKINDFFWPPNPEDKEEAALIIEVHRFLEGCACQPSVPQHLTACPVADTGEPK